MSWIIILIAIMFVACAFLCGMYEGRLRMRALILKEQKENPLQVLPTPVNIDLDHVYRMIDQVPNKVLQSIISSNNNLKGNLGEMMGYLKLKAEYDRVIPLGNITDFICISFPKEGRDGHIDFIDCKTDKARLSKDQLALRKLIQEKKINFIKLSFKIDMEAENYDSGAEVTKSEPI